MIPEETKNAVLKSLGRGHIAKIEAYAIKNGVTKENGEPYSSSMISMVLRGKRENHAIEDAIIACADQHLREKERRQKRLENLTEKLNAVH